MKCRICGNSESNIPYTAREMMLGLRESFQYFQCNNCNCLQISEIPNDIHKFYPKEYHSFEAITDSNFIKNYLRKKRNQYAVFGNTYLGKQLYKKNPEPAIRSLSELHINRETKILDVGCGTGKLLHSLDELGFKNIQGIDPYNQGDIINTHFSILKKTIHEVEGGWDLIMMHHSYEHVPDPFEVLDSISKLLNPLGRCLIRIPVVESYAWNNFETNWVQLDAPRHFHLHSPKSLSLLAKKAGLTVSNTIYDSTAFQFWGSIQYEHDISLNDERSYIKNPEDSLFSVDDIEEFDQKAAALNSAGKGDQAVFILEKV